MADQGAKRKLAAILSADVAGYSRLMGEDEQATVQTLTAYRAVFKDLIDQHKGRVVDTAGDSVLAEFGSVVEAVQCAVEVQQALQIRNDALPQARRMHFRIGVNLGDVIEQADGSIYGDGVNIAARLQALAEPGGICLSGTAYDHIENKLPLEYEYLGEQSVKNIAKPVRAYRVLSKPGAAAHRVIRAKRMVASSWRKVVLAVAAVVLLGGGVVAIWNVYLRPAPPSAEVASQQAPALTLPDKPSIAVMPFANISDNPDLAYFSDGLTEEIITTMSFGKTHSSRRWLRNTT